MDYYNMQKPKSTPNIFLIIVAVIFCLYLIDDWMKEENSEENGLAKYLQEIAEETEASNVSPNSIGSRKKPAGIGKTVSFNGTLYYKYCLDITVVDFIRGEEANKLVEDASYWNDVPDEGYEWILVKVKVKATNAKGNGAVPISQYDFDFVSTAGEVYNHETIFDLLPEFSDIY